MKHSVTFYWHDYETWGANPRLDRAAQFAGIRTDLDFNIIGQPEMFYCRTAEDILPHPQATLVTGLLPDEVDANALSESDFFFRINQLFSQPGSCVLGYNNIRFDDEVSRFGFYRSFIDPYAREWQNGNSRWDIIDMVRLTHALRPDGINWPSYDDGTPCLKLDQLTIANGIQHKDAHDALADVYATIAVARLIKLKQPRLYDYVFKHRQKGMASKLLYPGMDKPMLHVSSMYSSQFGNIAPVICLGADPVNANALFVYDLRHDPSQFVGLTEDQLVQRLFTRNEDMPEGMQRLPVKTVHINKCPVIVPLNTLTDVAAEQWDINLELVQQHLSWIQNQPDFLANLADAYNSRSFESDGNPDTALYDGFMGNADKAQAQTIRKMDALALKDFQSYFENPKYTELLFHYRARNWPETLSDEEKQQWREYCKTRLNTESQDGHLTLGQFETSLDELINDPGLSTENKALMTKLLQWGQQLKSKINV